MTLFGKAVMFEHVWQRRDSVSAGENATGARLTE
jgi:hypothetical protein